MYFSMEFSYTMKSSSKHCCNRLCPYFCALSSNFFLQSSDFVFYSHQHSISNELNELMSAALFCQLLMCAGNTAFYMVTLNIIDLTGISFYVSLAGLVNIILSTFIYCFLSENLTFELESIGSMFYNCLWYRLPIKHQRLFAFSIQRSQKIFRLRGFGIVECSLSVFSSVSFSTFEISKSNLLTMNILAIFLIFL